MGSSGQLNNSLLAERFAGRSPGDFAPGGDAFRADAGSGRTRRTRRIRRRLWRRGFGGGGFGGPGGPGGPGGFAFGGRMRNEQIRGQFSATLAGSALDAAPFSVRSRRASPRHAAGALLRLLLPALKVGVTIRLARDREVAAELTLGRFGLTRREAQIARLLARRATNREIADELDVSPHTVRHHIENIFAKLGIHSRRSIASQFASPPSS